jgi:hypothetical protein
MPDVIDGEEAHDHRDGERPRPERDVHEADTSGNWLLSATGGLSRRG